jgi:hypothetical protein
MIKTLFIEIQMQDFIDYDAQKLSRLGNFLTVSDNRWTEFISFIPLLRSIVKVFLFLNVSKVKKLFCFLGIS